MQRRKGRKPEMIDTETTIVKQIDILGTEYLIHLIGQISKDELVLGEIDYTNQIITLDSSMKTDVMSVTLLHEVIHGILFANGLNNENANEHLIQCLASGLHQVLVANPEIKSLLCLRQSTSG